jgi:predicted acetyltransferase
LIDLVEPSARYRESYLEALVEYHAEGRYPDRNPGNFDEFVTRLIEMADSIHVEPGFVPQTTWWLVDGGTYLGRIAIRHWLTEELFMSAGHIGYEIRPSRRRRGLGATLLALGLEQARALGLTRVLLTCYDDNRPSIRVIERNGGLRDEDFLIPGTNRIERRYWIELGDSPPDRHAGRHDPSPRAGPRV